jgi:hypothetical protein
MVELRQRPEQNIGFMEEIIIFGINMFKTKVFTTEKQKLDTLHFLDVMGHQDN